eukprot:122070-Chlamydomonas_euryale.AAC.1
MAQVCSACKNKGWGRWGAAELERGAGRPRANGLPGACWCLPAACSVHAGCLPGVCDCLHECKQPLFFNFPPRHSDGTHALQLMLAGGEDGGSSVKGGCGGGGMSGGGGSLLVTGASDRGGGSDGWSVPA